MKTYDHLIDAFWRGGRKTTRCLMKVMGNLAMKIEINGRWMIFLLIHLSDDQENFARRVKIIDAWKKFSNDMWWGNLRRKFALINLKFSSWSNSRKRFISSADASRHYFVLMLTVMPDPLKPFWAPCLKNAACSLLFYLNAPFFLIYFVVCLFSVLFF